MTHDIMEKMRKKYIAEDYMVQKKTSCNNGVFMIRWFMSYGLSNKKSIKQSSIEWNNMKQTVQHFHGSVQGNNFSKDSPIDFFNIHFDYKIGITQYLRV